MSVCLWNLRTMDLAKRNTCPCKQIKFAHVMPASNFFSQVCFLENFQFATSVFYF